MPASVASVSGSNRTSEPEPHAELRLACRTRAGGNKGGAAGKGAAAVVQDHLVRCIECFDEELEAAAGAELQNFGEPQIEVHESPQRQLIRRDERQIAGRPVRVEDRQVLLD